MTTSRLADSATETSQPDTAAASAEGSFFVFPMSPQHEAFWRIEEQTPGNSALNGAFRHELKGPLRIALWQEAWNRLVARHEALRASLRLIDGTRQLAIAEALHLALVIRDLCHLPSDARREEMERLCSADARHSFDLAEGPLIRVGLIRLADDQHVQTLTLHHAISDGWSIGILMDELPVVYAALLEGREPALQPIEIQYGDYLTWLQDYLKEPEIERQLEVWTSKLAGYQRLDVAGDKPADQGSPIDSDIVSTTLPDALVSKLKSYCNEQGGTLFTVGLAGLMATLHRETGRADLSVGSPVAGRNRSEFEQIVGPLLNYVILRVRLEPAMSLRDVEATVREQVFDAFANQDVPLETIADALRKSRDDLPDPLYSISFISQRAFAGGRNFTSQCGNVSLRTLPSKSQGALYDLFFFLVEREDGFRLSLDYRSQIFSKARASRLLDGLVTALETIATSPGTTIAELTAASRHVQTAQIAPSAEAAPVIAPADENITDSEANDGDEPVAMPVSFTQERFWLLSRAAPESSAFNMPSAMRVRGPLDVAHLERSLQDLMARHEILRTSFAEVDDSLRQIIAPSARFSLSVVSLEATGDEKTARIRREIDAEGARPFDLGAAPLLRGRLLRLGADEHVLILTLHDIVSDAQSVANLQRELWTIYDAHASGRQAELPPVELQYGDYAAWQREWIESDAARAQLDHWKGRLGSRLPVLDLPTDRRPDRSRPQGADQINRPIDADLVTRLKSLTSASGSTMFAVTASAFAALLARQARTEDVLFGFPVANRTTETAGMLGRFAGPMIYRLDLSGNPTLREIAERSRDATYDALSNADYPFEKLLQHIDARPRGGRNPLFQFYFLYQAAFVRELTAGALQMEPLPSPGTETTFELQLALIERTSGVTIQADFNPALFDRTTIDRLLDIYMETLDRLVTAPESRLSDLPPPRPRTTGDVAEPVDEVSEDLVPARSDTEKSLVEIWQRILGHCDFGIRSDFFNVGGQSLHAARLIIEIEKTFGVRLHLSVLATERTIEKLAERLSSGQPQSSSILVPLQAQGRQRPLFCVHGGGGHVLHYQDLAATMSKDHPVYGLSAPPMDGARDSFGVADLAKLYIDEIKRVQPLGPYRLCGYSFGGMVAYEMAVQLSEQGETVELLAIIDTANRVYYRHMPWSTWLPFWKVKLASRARRYLDRLSGGQLGEAVYSAGYFAWKHASRLAWRLTQKAYRTADVALPAAIQDNVIMFDAAADQYHPRDFSGRVVLLSASEREPEYALNPSLGWDQVARGGVEVMVVPGDHHSMVKSPNVMRIAERLAI